jgi:hypothetical protein
MAMPIKGVSEVRQIPRIGKIRLGIKVAGEKSDYPRAVDYFVCVVDQSTPEWAVKAFHAAYGDKPKTLDIMLPLNDTEKFFPQFYRRYGKGTGLICKGDGETATLRTESGDVQQKCDPENCEWHQKKLCRHIGALQFMLPNVQGLGVWQIDTTSYHSIINLNSGIDFVKGITGGRIAWLPLKLSVIPREVAPDGKKKTVYVMSLDNEQVKMEDILKASMLKPIHLLLPDLNMDEVPDDLFPASQINPDPVLSAPSQPAQPAQTATKEPDKRPPLNAVKLTSEHVQTACKIIQKSGAGDEVVKIVLKHKFENLLNEHDKINWPKLSMTEYEQICDLFSSNQWQKVYQEVMELEALGNDLPGLDDIEAPNLAAGGAKL